ncbi:MAG: hypothetical protein QOJ75_929, partial [Chloroflexota bacterium]|nr:hypothetical protein [Chloroflexota bacterium]
MVASRLARTHARGMLTLRSRALPVPHIGVPAPQAPVRSRFAIFMPSLFRLSIAFGFVEGLAAVASQERALIAAAVITSAFALVVLIADRLIDQGREMQATWLVALSLGVIGLLGTLVIPGVSEAMALMPVLALALLMPYANRRYRVAIVGMALGWTLLVLISADLARPAPLPEPFGNLFAQGVLVAIVGLVIAALVDFSDNARRSLGALETSVAQQQVQSDERAALGRVLESLAPKETVDATARAIAEALVTLPGITVGGVLEYQDGGLRIMALAAPAAFPLKSGDPMPEARALSLIASSAGGPWAERRLSETSLPELDAVGSVGLEALAYAPMRSGDQLLGLVGIGTSDPLHARHLVEDLPAIGEVAATATALLAPDLVARREVANVRGQIQAIIADRAFMPVFQAIVTIPDRVVVAYEALTRFTDGVRPDRHFAEAAAAGLGVELELVTLGAAVQAAERIPHALWL